MDKLYRRPISPLEKIFLSKVDVASKQQFTNQGIIEGTGFFDMDKWKHAVHAASIANVGSRVTLQKKNFKYDWTESDVFPTIRVVSDSQWDGMSSKNIEYLPDRLCPVNGPVCEVILIDGQKTKRVVINTLHAAMDGVGTVTWGADIFRFLRGESLVGSRSTLTDIEVVNKFKTKKPSGKKGKFISPFIQRQLIEKGGIWLRKIIPHTVSKIIPKICKVIAEESWQHVNGNVRIMIPVDLRRRMGNLISVGNLTGYLFLDIKKKQTVRDINLALIKQLRAHSDCYMPNILKFMRYLPVMMIHQSCLKEDQKNTFEGRYPFTGMITHLGRLSLDHLTAGEFKGYSWFSTNSMSGHGAPSVTITISEIFSENKKHCNLIVGAPKAQASYEELEVFSKKILQCL